MKGMAIGSVNNLKASFEQAAPVSVRESVMNELMFQLDRLAVLAEKVEKTFAPVLNYPYEDESRPDEPICCLPPLFDGIKACSDKLSNNLDRIESVINRSAL